MKKSACKSLGTGCAAIGDSSAMAVARRLHWRRRRSELAAEHTMAGSGMTPRTGWAAGGSIGYDFVRPAR